ncbi:MAG: SDR family NAD(P)-dependent oxidoreductase [Pseudomonadota bacterium]
MNSYDLKGRKAVVTGGGQGIGLAIVERFLESGAQVTIWDADRAVGERAVMALEGKGQVSCIDVDVSDWDRVSSATARTVAEMGGIDILAANAGIAGANAPIIDTEPSEWRKVIDIDLNGVFYCCKAVAPHMVEKGYGRIVNTASIAGKEGNPNAGHYSAAKAGVIALTKSLGKELAGHDIAVNCITPAAAKTAIFDQIEQYHIDFMLSKIPRNRFVKVEEIASMVTWLSSEENSFTTGAAFDLSGGRATY